MFKFKYVLLYSLIFTALCLINPADSMKRKDSADDHNEQGKRSKIDTPETKEVTYNFPKPQGNYVVGYKTFAWTDHQRLDPYQNDGQARKILIKFFYPTNCSLIEFEPYDRATIAMWKHEAKSELNTEEQGELKQLNQVRIHALPNAQIAQGKFPLILFLHGFDMTTGNYFSIIQELVSQGYIVLTIDHPYVASKIIYPDDGKEISCLAKRDTKAFKTCYRDTVFVLQNLKILHKNNVDELYQHIDFTKIGVTGHSLGGMLAITLARKLPRVKAGIALDAPLTIHDIPYDGQSGIRKPFLHMLASDHYETFGYSKSIKHELFSSNHVITFENTGHNVFADNALLKELLPLFKSRSWNLGAGDADGYEIRTQITKNIVSFFNCYIKNQGNF